MPTEEDIDQAKGYLNEARRNVEYIEEMEIAETKNVVRRINDLFSELEGELTDAEVDEILEEEEEADDEDEF